MDDLNSAFAGQILACCYLTLVRQQKKRAAPIGTALRVSLLFCFPQAVEVAVLVGGYDLIAGNESEYCLGLIAGLQRLTLAALLGLKNDPLDVMGIKHGMQNGAHGNGDGLSVDADHRDVLLARGVGGVGDQLLHDLSAAARANSGIVDVGDDVSAMCALVKLHKGYPPLIMYFSGIGAVCKVAFR